MSTERKIIASDSYQNKCECGEVATMQRYGRFEEGSNTPKDMIYLAFCPNKDCGNVFIATEHD